MMVAKSPSSHTKSATPGSDIGFVRFTGIMLLLLSVSTPKGPTDTLDPTFNGQEPAQYSRYPFLQYAASILANVNQPVHIDLTSPDANMVLNGRRSRALRKKKNEEDEEEDDDNADDVLSSAASEDTQGKTDSSASISPHESTPSDRAASPLPIQASAVFESRDIVENVLSFLPAKTALGASAVSTHLDKVVRETVQTVEDVTEEAVPLHARLIRPASIRFASLSYPEITKHAHRDMQWRCEQCGYYNLSGRTYCAEKACMHPVSEEMLAAQPIRLFVGQLPKKHTAQYLAWTIRNLAPEAVILHIESHTSGTQRGREKGCAWVYVPTMKDAESLLKLSGRLFADHEGLWVTDNTDKDRHDLAEFANMRSLIPDRAHNVLPRNCVVIEIPVNSAAVGGRRTNRKTNIVSPPPQVPQVQTQVQSRSESHTPRPVSLPVLPPAPEVARKPTPPPQPVSHNPYAWNVLEPSCHNQTTASSVCPCGCGAYMSMPSQGHNYYPNQYTQSQCSCPDCVPKPHAYQPGPRYYGYY